MAGVWSLRVPFNDRGLRRAATTVGDGVDRVRVEVKQRGAVGARVQAESLGVETRPAKSRDEERAASQGLSVTGYQDALDDMDLSEAQKEAAMAVFRDYKQRHSGEELVNLRVNRGY